MTDKHKNYENTGLKSYITNSAVLNQIKTSYYISLLGARSVVTTRLSFAVINYEFYNY
jgi:hypothetical protein